jgi:hypothetical protein
MINWLQIKRAAFEWTGILAATVSLLGLCGWVASVRAWLPDSRLDFEWWLIEVSVSQGEVTLFRTTADLELKAPLAPPYGFRLPGFQYQRMKLAGPRTVWMMKSSLLIPGLIAMIVAVGCIWQWRRTSRQLADHARLHLSPASVCPLDVPD